MRFAVVALVVLGLLVPATASAEVTLVVGKGEFQEQRFRETFYPNGFRLKGKTGTYRGPVTLEIDGFPYEGTYTDYGTVSTNDKGEYVFPKVVLGRNAMARVRAGSERSKAIQLYVYPGIKQKVRVKGDYLHLTHTLTLSPGWVPPDPNAAFVYILKGRENRLRRLGGARKLVQVGDGKWRFQGKARLPSSRKTYRFFTFLCPKGMSAAGYGRPWPLDQQCGRKYVTE